VQNFIQMVAEILKASKDQIYQQEILKHPYLRSIYFLGGF